MNFFFNTYDEPFHCPICDGEKGYDGEITYCGERDDIRFCDVFTTSDSKFFSFVFLQSVEKEGRLLGKWREICFDSSFSVRLKEEEEN
ncbi:hypothetical protein AB3R30_25270 [Leptolyngbyaceae cyanobacterium UHCC 1019]